MTNSKQNQIKQTIKLFIKNSKEKSIDLFYSYVPYGYIHVIFFYNNFNCFNQGKKKFQELEIDNDDCLFVLNLLLEMNDRISCTMTYKIKEISFTKSVYSLTLEK